MNGRLYRLTPAGGKPNHYTDSYASVLAKAPVLADSLMFKELHVGGVIRADAFWAVGFEKVERVA